MFGRVIRGLARVQFRRSPETQGSSSVNSAVSTGQAGRRPRGGDGPSSGEPALCRPPRACARGPLRPRAGARSVRARARTGRPARPGSPPRVVTPSSQGPSASGCAFSQVSAASSGLSPSSRIRPMISFSMSRVKVEVPEELRGVRALAGPAGAGEGEDVGAAVVRAELRVAAGEVGDVVARRSSGAAPRRGRRSPSSDFSARSTWASIACSLVSTSSQSPRPKSSFSIIPWMILLPPVPGSMP